ncbi:MAG: bifunctional oligoribonuclease/PAP phosphatase NrnA [Clostridia bacterium]|nr:bifunctional oligoribonuclease/PAP phosphatase NrnA [Clostridia bacterium]
MTDYKNHPAYRQAAELLVSRDDFAILCHVNPDGDTLGSAYGLAGMLEKLGKRVCVHCGSTPEPKFDYLREGLALACTQPQTVVSVDVATPELLGGLREVFPKVDLLFDHHGSGTEFAPIVVRDADASSATVVMLRMCELLGVEPDTQIADALFTGLTTDTGCFRYSNVTAEAHRAAIRLIEAGARTALINRWMFETKSRAEMDFTRLALDTLEYVCDGKVALLYVTDEMRRKSGFYSTELGEIPQFPRRVEGVVCGITVKQVENEVFKVSLRTNSELDATVLAGRFGGGGHVRAAGCTLRGSLKEVRERLIAAAQELV